MKKIIITALVSLFAIGTASADYNSDIQNDSIYASSQTEANFTSLPATAAGRSTDVEVQNFGGMQDDPSERLSGI